METGRKKGQMPLILLLFSRSRTCDFVLAGYPSRFSNCSVSVAQ